MSGASNAGNNGLWKITEIITAGDEVTATKMDGLSPVNETAFAGVFSDVPVDEPMLEYGNGLYYYDFTQYIQSKRYSVLIDANALSGLERYKQKRLAYRPI